MDGDFVPPRTISDPARIAKIRTTLEKQVHLMVREPDIRRWMRPGIDLAVVHLRAVASMDTLLSRAEPSRVGIAIGLDVPADRVRPYLDRVPWITVMGVPAGWSGQELDDRILSKIRAIRRWAPRADIAVDGGVNESTIPCLRRAGANVMLANSAIYKSRNVAAAMRRLSGIAA